jgi:hypothetical protein
MITRQPFLTAPPQDPLKGDASHAYTVCDMPSAVIASPGNAIVTAGAGARSVGRSTAAVRHALRTLASETGPRAGLRGVMRLRPLVTQAHDVLRERFEAGGTVEDYLRGRARLADSAVIGLLHIASVSTAMRGGNMVAPLAAVAVGGYGRNELAPGSDLDLLFLLPEYSQAGTRGGADATAACVTSARRGPARTSGPRARQRPHCSRRGPPQFGASTLRRPPARVRRTSRSNRGAPSAATLSASRARRTPGGSLGPRTDPLGAPWNGCWS